MAKGSRRQHLEALKMADAQRKRASFSQLRSKPRAQKEVVVVVEGEDGPEEVTMLFRAIGATAYDKLIEQCPPSPQDKEQGASYDINKFAPRLIAAVCAEPTLTVEEASEIWTSEEWNRGEVMSLFTQAVEVCLKGFDVNPTGSG